MRQFTVLIPTRERCDVLPDALETCVRQNYERLRIVVSDNASNDATREVVEDFRRRDSRVEYINPGQRHGMASHWEFALRHVTDGMLCMLGDDDGLMPGAIDDLNAAMDAYPGTRALQRGIAAYLYPDLPSAGAGKLTLELDPKIERRDSQEWLRKVASSQVIYTELPSPYYGCVDASLLEAIRARHGRLIHSQIPDAFLAVAVAGATDFYLHMGRPFTLTGGSRHSTGFSGNCPGASDTAAQTFFSENNLPFHPSLVFVRSVYVQQSDALVYAKELGLIAPDIPIAWDRVVCRALHDFHIFDFDPAWRQQEIEKLKTLSQMVGVQGTFDALMSHINAANGMPNFDELRAKTDLPLDAVHTTNPVLSVDMRPAGVRTIAQAAAGARLILDGAQGLADVYEPRLQQQESRLFKLRKRLRATHEKVAHLSSTLQKAVEQLHASRRWKWGGRLTNPFGGKNGAPDTKLNRALEESAQLKKRLDELIADLPKE